MVSSYSSLDKVFEYGLILKGISGLAELFAAILLFLIGPDRIHGFVVFITQKELLNEPNDIVANFLLHTAGAFQNGGITFAIVYLLVHAAVKLVAVIGILRQQLWAYPFSLIALSILVLYQLYSIYEKFSIGMILLTLFDLFIIWLIAREYRQLRTRDKDTMSTA